MNPAVRRRIRCRPAWCSAPCARTRGVPAQRRPALAPVGPPGEPGRQVEHRRAVLAVPRPGEPRPAALQLRRHRGAEVERQTHLPAVAAHRVGHPHLTALVGEFHLPPVDQRAVAVVLGAPARRLLPVGVHRQHPGPGVPRPQEGAARHGLVPAARLERVVPERGPEVAPPLGPAVVAVRARVGQHVDPVVPHLHGQRVRVGVRGDRQEAVRTAVAAAPDLPGPRSTVSPASAKCAGRLSGRATPLPYGSTSEASSGVRTSVPGTSGHQPSRPNTASPVASSDPQRSVSGPSSTSPCPSSASPDGAGAAGCRRRPRARPSSAAAPAASSRAPPRPPRPPRPARPDPAPAPARGTRSPAPG